MRGKPVLTGRHACSVFEIDAMMVVSSWLDICNQQMYGGYLETEESKQRVYALRLIT